jgi:hypothetical protein
MDQLRKEAREALQRDAWNRPPLLQAAFAATARNGLSELWEDLSSHDSTAHLDVRTLITLSEPYQYSDRFTRSAKVSTRRFASSIAGTRCCRTTEGPGS